MRADRLTLVLCYGIAGLGVAAALLHISTLYAGLLAACVATGLTRDWLGRDPLSTWVLNLLSICGLIVALALPSADGAIGRLLVAAIVLMGGKLLGPKASRDQLQIMLLSLLLLIGSAILTLDLSFAFLFLLYLVLCTTALVWLPFEGALGRRPVPRAFVRRVMTVGAALVVGSLPLVLLFFVALPRTASPYWRGVGPSASGVSGFSEEMTLGDVSRVASSDAVAFRAELTNLSGPLADTPYWRGMVFEDTDGITWSSRTRGAWEDPSGGPGPGPGGQLVGQRIYLEPHGLMALFSLDRALRVDSAPLYLQAEVVDGTVQARRTVGRRIRYEAMSSTSRLSPATLDPAAEAADLTIPVTLPRVVVTEAREIVGDELDPRRKAELMVEHFHSGGYAYSPVPPPAAGHPLAAFLTTKTGYCEHFASATALMLRSVGVPARVVVGYLGGDYNSTGNYYLVRQRTAHAWVEAYIAGEGWLRLDPTPPGQGGAAATVEAPGRTALLVDALRLRWQSMIMGYDLGEQLAMANAVTSGLGRGVAWRPGASDLDDLAVVGLLVVAIAVASILLRREARGDPVDALYGALLHRLGRRGFPRGATEGPADFAARAAAGLPSGKGVIEAVTDLYVRARYGGRRPRDGQVQDLRRKLRRL